jgi:dihydrofolate reductase
LGRLIYSTFLSLDGYIEDADGTFDWSAPTPEVHAFVNAEIERLSVHLYGRRLYETMAVWETMDDPAPEMRDFASSWRAAEKIVYSRTLSAVSSARTRIERTFEPERVREFVRASETDVLVGGARLAGDAFRAGIVDEIDLYVVPVLVGGGLRALPDGARLDLELLEERRFGDGTLFLRYVPRNAVSAPRVSEGDSSAT